MRPLLRVPLSHQIPLAPFKLPQCRAEVQICRKKPRHPPDQSQFSLSDETTPVLWLFSAHSRTTWRSEWLEVRRWAVASLSDNTVNNLNSCPGRKQFMACLFQCREINSCKGFFVCSVFGRDLLPFVRRTAEVKIGCSYLGIQMASTSESLRNSNVKLPISKICTATCPLNQLCARELEGSQC